MSCHHRCLVRLGITINIHVPNDNEFDFVNDMRVVPLSVPVLVAEMFFWALTEEERFTKRTTSNSVMTTNP
jgi:hypothetical protein